MKKILVVDDDPDITLLLKTKLEKTGQFSVIITNDSRKVFALAKQEAPDLLVCDIDMPVKSGGEVAAELAENTETAGIPVLFLSSLVRPEDIRAGKVGGRHMVSKASHPEELIRRISLMLS